MSSPTQETEHFLKYSDDDPLEPTSERTFPPSPTKSAKKIFLSYLLVAIGTSFIWITILLIFSSPSTQRTQKNSHPHQHPHAEDRWNITTGAHLLTCGTTPTSARRASCIYDPLLNHWVPAPCYDESFLSEYLDDGSFTAYTSAALSETIPLAELGDREEYYTSVRDHVNHCAVMWRKQFYVLFEGRRFVDSVVASEGHTEHCAFYLTLGEGGGPGAETEATKVQVGFAGCWARW